jgi:hypothetical protein
MTKDKEITYEELEEQQRNYCKQLDEPCIPLDPDSRVGIALATQGRLPINGLRHPPEGDMNGWYLWSGEEFPADDNAFSPVHPHHLVQLLPEVVKFLGLPPGYRFLVAGDVVDVWFDPSLLDV